MLVRYHRWSECHISHAQMCVCVRVSMCVCKCVFHIFQGDLFRHACWRVLTSDSSWRASLPQTFCARSSWEAQVRCIVARCTIPPTIYPKWERDGPWKDDSLRRFCGLRSSLWHSQDQECGRGISARVGSKRCITPPLAVQRPSDLFIPVVQYSPSFLHRLCDWLRALFEDNAAREGVRDWTVDNIAPRGFGGGWAASPSISLCSASGEFRTPSIFIVRKIITKHKRKKYDK